MSTSFAEFLNAAAAKGDAIVIDGATGSELGKYMPESMSANSWTALTHLCEEGASTLGTVHRHYLQAGSAVITTNTYCANQHCLAPDGVDEDGVAKVNQAAVRIAREAISAVDDETRDFYVWGSVSPHPPCFKKAAAKLAVAIDGDVARADAVAPPTAALDGWPCVDEEERNYANQMRLLRSDFVDPATGATVRGVDCIALEMVKDYCHGDPIVRAAASQGGFPVVLGLTVVELADGTVVLRDDQTPIVEAVKHFLELGAGSIVAVNIMHSPIDAILPAMRDIRTAEAAGAFSSVTSKRLILGGYPNNGTAATWPKWTEGDVTPTRLAEAAAEWHFEAGATLAGGCCGLGVSHIEHLAAMM